jgi:hypothetical protein
MTFSSDPSLNTNQLPISIDINPEEEAYQATLQLYIRRIANATNTKVSGLHLLQETATFKQYFGTTPQQNRNSYRTTFDLVALHGGNIANGTTTLTLTTTTQPPAIIGYMFPTSSNGGALGTNGISYFINGQNIEITFNSSTNTIIIVNNTGVALTWCEWAMEYLKN